MKRSLLPYVLISAALVLLASAPGAGPGDLTLFDAPRGAWLGTLRIDAPVEVLAEEDGWRRIRLEAWVPVSSAGASPSGATIRGVLTAEGDGPAGSSLIVLLASDLEAMDRDHARAGAECAARLAGIDARISSLGEDARRALNSSDNFREAATRSDHVKQELSAAQTERREALSDCRGTAEKIFQRHAVERTISNDQGSYEFLDIPPGRYRVIAIRTAAPSLAWSLDCSIEGGGMTVLDPAEHSSPVRPFWGLK